jgi:poly-gamma-glutamate synthesis protein (capsule biosynthesis protein)
MLKKLLLIIVLIGAAIAVYKLHNRVTITATGDILLDRGVLQYIERENADYPFEKVRGMLKGDIVIGNLEGPVSYRGYPLPKVYTFRFSPATLSSVKRAGFNVLNLANNHSLDYGRDALVDTIKYIRKEKMLPVGAGSSQEEAARLLVLKKKGVTLALLAFSVFPYEGIFYDENLPGVSLAGSPEEVKHRVAEAAERADVIIVSFHWGREFSEYPSKDQKELAHAAVDGGATLVLGHHPHVLQGVERYKDSLILYSLGNFVFDQSIPRARETAIAKIGLYKNAIQYLELTPLVIADCRPQVPDEVKGKEISERIAKMSSYLGLEGFVIKENGVLRVDFR